MIGGGNGNNSDECACFYMAGPTHRIKGKKVTKRNGMVTTEGARAFFFLLFHLNTVYRYHLHGTRRQGICTREQRKLLTYTHTQTHTGGRTREM